jgi:hypothetical protein
VYGGVGRRHKKKNSKNFENNKKIIGFGGKKKGLFFEKNKSFDFHTYHLKIPFSNSHFLPIVSISLTDPHHSQSVHKRYVKKNMNGARAQTRTHTAQRTQSTQTTQFFHMSGVDFGNKN